MLTSEEAQRLVETHRLFQNDVQLNLNLTDDPRSADFQSYCDRLADLASGIRVKKDKEPGTAPPSIGLGQTLLFQALPRGTEFAPFLDLLAAQSGSTAALTDIPAHEAFEVPAMFKVYVSPVCPFCPLVLKHLFAAAMANPAFHLTVVDGILFPEMAQTDRIKSVPTLILDDNFRWTGSVDMDEVNKTARHRDPSKLSVPSLKSMILNGDAFHLADMMIREQNIFPAFVELLAHEAFSTRLGAMAVAEELAAKDRQVAAGLIAPLIERFEQLAETVQGDILFVMGKAGDRRILRFLEHVAAGPYPHEVKEAAIEAIQDIHHQAAPG